MAESIFKSAELRNKEVVGWVFGYSQSPISSFPISLFYAFLKQNTIPQIWRPDFGIVGRPSLPSWFANII